MLRILALALVATFSAVGTVAAQTPEKAISLREPNGGEKWTEGGSHSVVWTLRTTSRIDSITVRLVAPARESAKPQFQVLRTLLTLQPDKTDPAKWTSSSEKSICLSVTEAGSTFVVRNGRLVPESSSVRFSCSIADVGPVGEKMRIEVTAYQGKTRLFSDTSDAEFAIQKN